MGPKAKAPKGSSGVWPNKQNPKKGIWNLDPIPKPIVKFPDQIQNSRLWFLGQIRNFQSDGEEGGQGRGTQKHQQVIVNKVEEQLMLANGL